MSLTNLFDRARDAGQQAPAFNPRQRLAQQAQELDRAGNLQARLDVCTMATAALIKLLYKADADNRLVNVDEVTGKILIPVPWGSNGWKRWNIRKWEAECWRKILLSRCRGRGSVLFGFDMNQWFVDIELFPTMDTALLWLRESGPTLSEWRAQIEHYQARQKSTVR